MAQLRFSEISEPRQAFIRPCQRMGFGKIFGLVVRNRDPILDPRTEVFLDVKLDSTEVPRPEQDLSDFVLCVEILRLFNSLAAMNNGIIERVEVRAGIPVRMIVRTNVQE